MVDAEEAAAFEEGYINDSDPSVLRFLIASRRACPKTLSPQTPHRCAFSSLLNA